jgi:hypothetical protein
MTSTCQWIIAQRPFRYCEVPATKQCDDGRPCMPTWCAAHRRRVYLTTWRAEAALADMPDAAAA